MVPRSDALASACLLLHNHFSHALHTLLLTRCPQLLRKPVITCQKHILSIMALMFGGASRLSTCSTFLIPGEGHGMTSDRGSFIILDINGLAQCQSVVCITKSYQSQGTFCSRQASDLFFRVFTGSKCGMASMPFFIT